MAVHLMETTLRTALWQQFGATIDMLEQHAIPDEALDWVPRAKDEAGL